MIKQDHFGILGRGDGADLVRLATAHVEARVGPVATTAHIRHGNGTSRARELREFLDVFGIRGGANSEAHQYGPLTCARSLEHVS